MLKIQELLRAFVRIFFESLISTRLLLSILVAMLLLFSSKQYDSLLIMLLLGAMLGPMLFYFRYGIHFGTASIRKLLQYFSIALFALLMVSPNVRILTSLDLLKIAIVTMVIESIYLIAESFVKKNLNLLSNSE